TTAGNDGAVPAKWCESAGRVFTNFCSDAGLNCDVPCNQTDNRNQSIQFLMVRTRFTRLCFTISRCWIHIPPAKDYDVNKYSSIAESTNGDANEFNALYDANHDWC